MATEITTVELETPLIRGETELKQLRFRRPVAGDLRGLSIAKLGQLDYDEVRKLAPRITMDGLIDAEVDKLDSADLIELSSAFADFLFQKRHKAALQTT